MIQIDELNTTKFDAEQYIREYFAPMQISKERKEERQEAAKDFRDVLLFILALISVENGYNALDWAYIEEQFRIELERAALQYARVSQALSDYIAEKASDFVAVTQSKELSDPYWTSDERATYEAVNEANSVVGLSEMQRAKERGAVKKRWRTERDNRVRRTHQMVDGKSVALDRMFEVGDALMRFPCDFLHSVRESVNCRCCLEYTDATGKVVSVGKKGDIVTKTDEKVQYTNADNGGILMLNKATGETVPLSEKDNANRDVEKMSQREREYYLYSESWPIASLKEALEKFAPGTVGNLNPKKRKIVYKGEKHNVVYDYIFDYFRIEDPIIHGRRRYLLMDGTNPSNMIMENGTQRGRTKEEYEMITHFKNGDRI